MQTTDHEDLDWTAFRYISNEMAPAEVVAFEQRLAEDQLACEAVARAVEWSQAVAAVPADSISIGTRRSSVVTRHSAVRRWNRSLRWFAAAAAVVLGVLGVQFFRGSSDTSRLAKVWVTMWSGRDAMDFNDHDLLAGPEDSLLDDDDDLAVPAWMIEAVGGGSDSDKWEDS